MKNGRTLRDGAQPGTAPVAPASKAAVSRIFKIRESRKDQPELGFQGAADSEIGDTAQRGEAATKVAQNCILPYRRFAIGSAFDLARRVARSSDPQNTILRYSRDTAD